MVTCHLLILRRSRDSVNRIIPSIFCRQVVQVYVSWPANASVPVPKLQLVGFQRVRVDVGKTVDLKFTIVPDQLRVWISDTVGWGHLAGACASAKQSCGEFQITFIQFWLVLTVNICLFQGTCRCTSAGSSPDRAPTSARTRSWESSPSPCET